MNYHGYLILLGGPIGTSAINRFFDPWTGPLSTRFAATFVMVAGMGITLMTNRGRLGRDRATTQRGSLDTDPPRDAALRVRVRVRVDLERHDPVLLRRVSSSSARSCSRCARGGSSRSVHSQRLPRPHCSGGRSRPMATPIGCSGAGTPATPYRSPRRLLFDTFVNGTHPLLAVAGVPVRWHGTRPVPALASGAATSPHCARRGDGRRHLSRQPPLRRHATASTLARHRSVQPQPQLHDQRPRLVDRRVLRDRLDRQCDASPTQSHRRSPRPDA